MMRRIQMRRRPVVYLAAAASVIAAHAWLSYPAAVARGHPPLDLRDFLAPFVAPFGMALPPLFDDGRSRPRLRVAVVAAVSLGFAFVWALIDANDGVTPHIGHLAGIRGILEYKTGDVVFGTLLFAALGFPFFFCYDRVASGFWSLLRHFGEET